MDKLKTIICGIDFSKNSKCALRQAARIAEWNGADIIAVHVLDKALLEAFTEIPQQELEVSAVTHLENLVFEVLGDATKARQEVFAGNPFRSLSDFVESESADLLVLGVHGHGTETDTASPAGTTARKCVRKIPAKVLLVRGDQPGDFRSIVHCTDFSTPSSQAFEQAIAIAREEKATLEVIYSMIAPERLLYGMGDGSLYSYVRPEALRERADEDMARYVKGFESQLDGMEVKTTIVEASHSAVGNTLVEAIANSGADLAVLGTHGRGAITGMLMGTTAEKIVAHAPCSILAVKPDNFKAFWK